MARELTDEDLKRYYSIGEVADILGIAASKIRFWDGEFKHLKPGKNSRGERRFTRADMAHIQQIDYLLNERGFTISGARREIALRKQQPQRAELITGLQEARRRLLQLLTEAV